MLQRVAACSSVLQHVAACCSMLQRVAVNDAWHHAVFVLAPICTYICPSLSLCCSMLQHVAAWCSVLQCVAGHDTWRQASTCIHITTYITEQQHVLQHAAACCSVSQRSAVRCGMLHCCDHVAVLRLCCSVAIVCVTRRALTSDSCPVCMHIRIRACVCARVCMYVRVHACLVYACLCSWMCVYVNVFVTVCHSVLQRIAVRCQCVTVCCSVLQCAAERGHGLTRAESVYSNIVFQCCSALLCVAVHVAVCAAVCVAVCCRFLRRVAVCNRPQKEGARHRKKEECIQIFYSGITVCCSEDPRTRTRVIAQREGVVISTI